jgi:hypothetical protein
MEIWDGRSTYGRKVFAEYLLSFLNSNNAEGFEYIIGMYAGIPAPMKGVRLTAPKRIRDTAIHEFRSTLRKLVDLWIYSGKQGEIEQPWDRSFQFTSPDSPATIEHILIEFWRKYPPMVLVTGQKQAISTQSFSLISHSNWEHLADKPESELLENARAHAVGFFASAMDSPSRFRIFRCENCHTYFSKKRMPKKGVVIKGGSFCEQCKAHAVKRRVYSERDKRLARMIGWAADAVLQWKPSRPFDSQAHWVVSQLRRRQPSSERPIQVNWYTHHEDEIEAEVKRRKQNGTQKTR